MISGKSSFSQANATALAAGLALQWYPHAKQYGQSLRVGNLAGDPGYSLWICLRTGAWKDHASGEAGGDLISLYAAKQNISQVEAKQALAGSVGCSQGIVKSHPTYQNQYNRKYALKLWREAEPLVSTPGASYLKGRGISCLPDSLRFHSSLYHKPTRQDYSAILAGITRWPKRSPHAIHRTFLDGYKKAAITPNRMMLGDINGGAVRLGPVFDVLAVAEGIETALSFQQMTNIPTWAILSASNYVGLILSPGIKEIIIAADHDEIGLQSARRAAELWSHQGIRVRVVHPPRPGSDFNDFQIESMK